MLCVMPDFSDAPGQELFEPNQNRASSGAGKELRQATNRVLLRFHAAFAGWFVARPGIIGLPSFLRFQI